MNLMWDNVILPFGGGGGRSILNEITRNDKRIALNALQLEIKLSFNWMWEGFFTIAQTESAFSPYSKNYTHIHTLTIMYDVWQLIFCHFLWHFKLSKFGFVKLEKSKWVFHFRADMSGRISKNYIIINLPSENGDLTYLGECYNYEFRFRHLIVVVMHESYLRNYLITVIYLQYLLFGVTQRWSFLLLFNA